VSPDHQESKIEACCHLKDWMRKGTRNDGSAIMRAYKSMQIEGRRFEKNGPRAAHA